MLSKIITLSTLAVLTVGTSGTAYAQPADYRTYFTFSAPVTLPGVTLPAGKYLFRLANPDGSRKVINVLSEDGTKSLAMLHSIPNQLPSPPENPEIRFMETAANVPPAIKTWWYPGRSIGYEFIYPRQQALQLAKGSSEPVLTTSTETNDLEKGDLSRISGSGVPDAVTVEENPAPVAATGRAQRGEVAVDGNAPASSSARTESARTDPPAVQAVPPPAETTTSVARNTPPASQTAPFGSQSTTSSEVQDTRAARTRLPQTASSTPYVVLFGALAMLAGLGLSLWPRRHS